MAGAQGPSIPTCPYCQWSLATRPHRKTKCKRCGKAIFVKTLPATGERALVTEEQAAAIEAEWIAIYRARSSEVQVARYHLDDDVFRERRTARKDLGDRDIIWGMFNEDAQSLMKQGDFHGLSCRYYEMALFLAAEDRDFTELLAACHKAELHALKGIGGIKKVEIMPGGDSCSACQELSGKKLTIEEALRTMPLPCKNCTMNVAGSNPGFCRCQYTALVD